MIICSKCKTAMDCQEIGAVFVYGFTGDRVRANGDEYTCPNCGGSVLADFGKPVHEKEEGTEEFERTLREAQKECTVHFQKGSILRVPR